MLGYENKLLPTLYNAADITIVPSYSEGGPLITPESLACGTLVIATSVGGNPEYLEIVHLDPLLVRIHDYDFFRYFDQQNVYSVARGVEC